MNKEHNLFEQSSKMEDFKRDKVSFYELWYMLNPPVQDFMERIRVKTFFKYKITATILKDVTLHKWNQTHPVENNTTFIDCKSGSRVKINMISRMGDIGITDDLNKSNGYDLRGLDCDNDFKDWTFTVIK
jgi:hypothetical protein